MRAARRQQPPLEPPLGMRAGRVVRDEGEGALPLSAEPPGRRTRLVVLGRVLYVPHRRPHSAMRRPPARSPGAGRAPLSPPPSPPSAAHAADSGGAPTLRPPPSSGPRK